MLFMPLSVVGQIFEHHETYWHAEFSERIAVQLSTKFYFFTTLEVWMDTVFCIDLFYKLARAMVRDLGHDDSPVDRLVSAASTAAPVQQQGHSREKQSLVIDKEGRDHPCDQGLKFGKAVRWHAPTVLNISRILLVLATVAGK
jgi:hypothetical protein